MSHTELANQMFVALDAAELLATQQIAAGVEYLISGQGFSLCEVHSLIAGLLSAYPERSTSVAMRPYLVK